MRKRLFDIALCGILISELLCGGCASVRTIDSPAYRPFLSSEALSPDALFALKKDSPKDAVFADLLQAFALMRTGAIEQKNTQQQILDLLRSSVSSFEDLSDPVNFSKAFSADESKNFRGSAAERMYASAMTGIFEMAQNRCDLALPYLRNAEFLDARFQKMPFGTDAPLIYALSYRCLKKTSNDAAGLKRAADGVYHSVRFLNLKEPLLKALVAMASTDMRELAITRRIAYMLYEISLYYTLLTAPSSFSVGNLLDDAAKNAELFTQALDTNFANEFKERIKPSIKDLAELYGQSGKDGQKHLQELALQRLPLEVKTIATSLKRVVTELPVYGQVINRAVQNTDRQSQEILRAADAPKLALNFTGMGPTLKREGEYDQISVIVPSPDAKTTAAIRERSIKTDMACGFHRTANEGFSVVLCDEKTGYQGQNIENILSLELMSLSQKRMMIGGREFDKVLANRAQFRAATEGIATVSAWSAFFLFYLGASLMEDCQRRGEGEACYARGMAVWGIAGLTAIFSGAFWLIGRASNPAADSRFIHLMYESAWYGV